jgi:predicted Zn-dependent protease
MTAHWMSLPPTPNRVPPLPRRFSSRRSRLLDRRCGVAIGLSMAALFVGTSCTTVDLVTGRETNNLFSIADDIGFGKTAFQELTAEMGKEKKAVVSKDPKATQRIQTISKRIFQASGCEAHFDFGSVLFESDIVNAFAFPGGKVAVFSGIWDKKEGFVRDDDELAAVIAHEVAHVTCRHSTEAMTRHLPAELLLTAVALYADYKQKDDWSKAIEAAFVVYNGVIIPKYSRADEAEADRVGMAYMAGAGYDPRAAVRLWKRACDQEGKEAPALSILSTHPANKDRYAALSRQLPSALELYEATKAKSPTLTPPASARIGETKLPAPATSSGKTADGTRERSVGGAATAK